MYKLSPTFNRFFESEKTSGLLLLTCTVISLGLANSAFGTTWVVFWETPIAALHLSHWINDGLMAIFFLLIGLELKRELSVGELSDLNSAMLPVIAALGGMIAPALIHYVFNAGLSTQAGIGIPMATDIAFALGVLALLGKRVPPALKVFVTAFAVIDDLGAIVVIALFYSNNLQIVYLAGSLAIWGILFALNRLAGVQKLAIYLIGGAVMWVFMLKSGVHATIAGVMLAFAIPALAPRTDSGKNLCPSHRLEKTLHAPVAFVILPIFALANTSVLLNSSLLNLMLEANSLGIAAGLVLGKPLGVTLLTVLAIQLKWCKLPEGLTWQHVLGAGMLGGIGFTMSIFITNLAFGLQPEMIDASKLAVFGGSLLSGILGALWLGYVAKNHARGA